MTTRTRRVPWAGLLAVSLVVVSGILLAFKVGAWWQDSHQTAREDLEVKPYFELHVLANGDWTIEYTIRAAGGAPGSGWSRSGGGGSGGVFREHMYRSPPADGTYEISGTFTATPFGLGFGVRNGSAGAEAGSLESVVGPNPQVSNCSVTYVSDQIGTQQFLMRFRTTADSANLCRRP